jgi:hypothetical protein
MSLKEVLSLGDGTMIGLVVLMVVAQGPATAWEMKLPYEEGKKYLFQTELKVNIFGSKFNV